MLKHHFLLRYIFPCLIACSSSVHAASITWVAQNPNNDMNDSANWNPNTIPGSSDDAIFNSTISHINTNPTENSAPFSVSTFNFVSHDLSTAEWQHAFMHLCDGSIRNVIYPILLDFQFQQSKSSTDCHLFGSGPSVLFIDAESSYYFSRRVFCTRMFICVPT